VVTDSSIVADLPVSTFMGDSVAGVAPDTPLDAVAEALVQNSIGAVVTRRGAHIDGIVSERDIVRAVAAHQDLDAVRAIDVATTHLVWCDETASVAEVAAEMMEHYVRHVLVERRGRLVGIVSARDLLAAYAADSLAAED
jgi:CBS domain-containing protein